MANPTEKSIFLEALEKATAQEREAFVADACAGRPVLRAEIEELLRAHDRPDNMLDGVPDGGATSVVEGPGTSVGPYRLMERIGEGGFGLVFVAEQQRPVRRKVALKVIKPGMDTRDVIARFEAERQALALMDHPNIARVLDAGETETGRPYFVMELVRGVPITELCDRSQLSPRERLDLFIQVCQAVQHAHQKGVIHRDLKPTNVLVTLHDGSPVAKVIDFGVAKAIGQHLTEKTIYTRFAQMIGTPLYMSPEQAEMSGLDVDTRSDIYSLGVLLYELLTGTRPFDPERLRTAGFDEVRRIIREEEPPRPSERLTTLGAALATVSANRHTDPGRLVALVRGDLDWIVMKAIEKDRARRYETASALAADVRRFLNEEPIEARPPSALYRFRKYARRHRVALTTVSVVAAALVLGSAMSAWQAVRARLAEAEAVEARKKIEAFSERLNAANVLLDNARAYAEEGRWADTHAEYTRATELLPEHFMVWSGRGSLYVRLGLWKRAAADYARAVELGATPRGPVWWGVPALLLYAGDETGHRDVCTRMLQQLEAAPDAAYARMVIRSCVIASRPVTGPDDLAARAEKVMNGGPAKKPGGPRFLVQPPYYIAGLANYRAGRYNRAIELFLYSLNSEPRWPVRGIIHPALAMAYHRIGRNAVAREELAAAGRAIDQWTGRMVAGPVGTIPIPWYDLVECIQLYREAKLLITGHAPPEDPRLRTIEQRANEALNPG